MGFLTPLFLVGLAGLAVPVLIHLTRQEKGKSLGFPSLMFLRRIPFEETSRRRIRHWLLLVMRLAALGLLVAAFARPFVRGGALASVGGPGPEEVVILLDRSYSMDLGDNWARAVDHAKGVAAALRTQDRVSLVTFSETPHLLHRSISDPARVAATLDTLRTGSLATRIGPAIKLARSTLAASERPRQRVVLISDFQRPGWRPDPDATLPAGVTLEPVVIGGENAANLALTDLELGRESAGNRERVTVSARLINTGDTESTTEVTLAVNDTDVGTATVTTPAGGAAPFTFDPFTLTHPFTRGEVRVAEAPGTGLGEDNALHFVASPGGDLSVLIVDPLGGGDSNLYLRGALGIAEGAGFATVLTRGAPRESQLAAADVVVLNGAPFPGGSAGDRLRAFVEEGGGLLLVLGQRTTVPSVHAEFLPATVGPVTEGTGERRLGFVDYDHAVFEAFMGPRSGDFSQAAFYRTRRLDVTDGRVTAQFDDGTPALVEGRRGKGRILVWATGLDRFWNNLALQPVYLPFVHRVTRFLGGRGEIPPWHTAGSTVNLSALATAGVPLEIPPGAVAMEPGGGSVALDPATSLLRLESRGIWEIRPPGERPEHPMAVAANVDVTESDLARMDIEEFVAAVGGETAGGTAGDDSTTADAAAVDPQAADFESRQSFWRYLLAAVFLLMVSETVLANRLSRHRIKEESAMVG
ncbi:MAG: BatA domain-containing protein [Gemmatimonadota bacterium]|nr:BatA domain-containing protein [Gemmatimonadota bacterium]MDE2983503.1 BatA domain-containing protein [Gemmatimonadota bacterium]